MDAPPTRADAGRRSHGRFLTRKPPPGSHVLRAPWDAANAGCPSRPAPGSDASSVKGPAIFRDAPRARTGGRSRLGCAVRSSQCASGRAGDRASA
eukprot:4652545-Prymnesium_polylepis.1